MRCQPHANNVKQVMLSAAHGLCWSTGQLPLYSWCWTDWIGNKSECCQVFKCKQLFRVSEWVVSQQHISTLEATQCRKEVDSIRVISVTSDGVNLGVGRDHIVSDTDTDLISCLFASHCHRWTWTYDVYRLLTRYQPVDVGGDGNCQGHTVRWWCATRSEVNRKWRLHCMTITKQQRKNREQFTLTLKMQWTLTS